MWTPPDNATLSKLKAFKDWLISRVSIEIVCRHLQRKGKSFELLRAPSF